MLYRGGELAGGVLRPSPKPEIKPTFPRWIEEFSDLFLCPPEVDSFLSSAWSAPGTCHRPLCEHGDPINRVGRSP